MSGADRSKRDPRAAFWRGLTQAAIVSLAALAIVALLWLIARHAPSAGGVPLATVAPTPILPTIRFELTAFPTAPPIRRQPTPTPGPAVTIATPPKG